jgi:hypothetical protein
VARQVDDHLPLAVGVDCSLRFAVKHIRWADVATTIVVVMVVAVAPVHIIINNEERPRYLLIVCPVQ